MKAISAFQCPLALLIVFSLVPHLVRSWLGKSPKTICCSCGGGTHMAPFPPPPLIPPFPFQPPVFPPVHPPSPRAPSPPLDPPSPASPPPPSSPPPSFPPNNPVPCNDMFAFSPDDRPLTWVLIHADGSGWAPFGLRNCSFFSMHSDTLSACRLYKCAASQLAREGSGAPVFRHANPYFATADLLQRLSCRALPP